MEKKAMVLIGHGSTLPYNREVVIALSRMIRSMNRWDEVSYCFLEIEPPSIEEVLDDVCQDGAIQTIVFAPVFIASGAHIQRDIPRALKMPEGGSLTQRTIRGVKRRILLSGPIGADKELASIIERKATEAIASSPT